MTLGEAHALFRDALSTLNYAPETRLSYRHSLHWFLVWLGGDTTREVTSVRRADIEAYQGYLAEKGLAKATQACRIRAVKRWFEWLADRGYLFQSPAEAIIETPEGMRKLPEVLTLKEIRRLLEVPNTSTWLGIRDRAILELLYSTGMRRGECTALDLRDVDLDAGLAYIQSGKGRKGRVVPFGAQAKKWLKEYVTTLRSRYQKRNPTERAFFLDRFGKRVSGDVIYKTVRDAAKSAGIRKKTYVHALRHAFATHMLASGADIVTIQKLLGHVDARVTSSVYTRVLPQELKLEHARTHPSEIAAGGNEPTEQEGS